MSNWDINNTVKTNSDLLDYLRTYKISPYEAFALIHKQKFKHGKTRDWQLCKYRMYINHRIIDFVNFDRRSKKLTKFDKKTFLSKFPRAKSIKNTVYSKNYEIAFKIYNPKKPFDVDRKRLEVKNLEKLIPSNKQSFMFRPDILSSYEPFPSSFRTMSWNKKIWLIDFLR